MNHHDGSLAAPDAAGGRGGSQGRGGGLAGCDEAREWRQLSFRTSGLTVEVEVIASPSDGAGARRLAGRLLPPQSAAVDIRHPGGVITVPADPFGRFSADGVPPGQVRLRCRLGADPEHPAVTTGWVAL